MAEEVRLLVKVTAKLSTEQSKSFMYSAGTLTPETYTAPKPVPCRKEWARGFSYNKMNFNNNLNEKADEHRHAKFNLRASLEALTWRLVYFL